MRFLPAAFTNFISSLFARSTNPQQQAPQKPIDPTLDSNQIGAVVASPSLYRTYRDYQDPQNQRKYIEIIREACLRLPMLDAAVEKLATGSVAEFKGIKVETGPQSDIAQQVIDDFINRVQLKKDIATLVYRWLKYGTVYLENVLSQNSAGYYIKELKYLPPETMIPLMNERGSFDDPAKAYIQQDVALGLGGVGQSYASFANWQITRIIHDGVAGDRYGRSVIEAAVLSGIADKVADMLDNLYSNRLRSAARDVFTFNPPPERNSYPAELGKAIQKVLSAVSKNDAIGQGKPLPTDLVLVNTTAARLQSDSNTDKVADIEILLEQALGETGVSPQMLTADRAANVGVLLQRIRELFNSQARLADIFCQQLNESIKLELALNSIDPGQVKWEYIFGQKLPIEDARNNITVAISLYDKGLLTPEEMRAIAANALPIDPGAMKFPTNSANQVSNASNVNTQQLSNPASGETNNSTQNEQTDNSNLIN